MVYAGNVFIRRLFYDTPVLRFNLFGSHMDRCLFAPNNNFPQLLPTFFCVLLFRSSIPACSTINDCTRHSSVSQHIENFQFYTSCSVSVHIYICMAYSGRNHPFGKLLSKIQKQMELILFCLVREFRRSSGLRQPPSATILDLCVFSYRHHVHRGLW